jgi:cytoskeletal protein CcmA (bactofilin family)
MYNGNNNAVLHEASNLGHEFTNTGSTNRLQIRNTPSCVDLCAVDDRSIPQQICLSATEVRLPSCSLTVGNRLSVGADGTVAIGAPDCGVFLNGSTVVADGGLSINSGAFRVGAGLFTANSGCVAVNCLPEAGNVFKVDGNTFVTGMLSVQRLSVCGGTNIAGGLSVSGPIMMAGATVDSLGVSGNVRATNVAASDSLTSNVLTVRDAATVGNLVVITNANFATLRASGPAVIAAPLTVFGQVTVAGNIVVSNGAIVASSASFGATSVAGNLAVAGPTRLDSLVATSANVSSYLSVARFLSVGGPALPGVAASVTGNARVSDSLTVANTISASRITVGNAQVGGALAVAGDAAFANDVRVAGDVVAGSIVAPADSLTFTANSVYFNTRELYFKSNSYVVDTAAVTYVDKVIRLGSYDTNNAIRDGSGIQLTGAPDNKPANVVGTMAIRWLAQDGLFAPDGSVVPPKQRARWEISGGNLCLKSADENFSYMWSIDTGELNLWKITLMNGAVVSTQRVATFGRTIAN